MAKADTVTTDRGQRSVYAGPIHQISLDAGWLEQASAAMFDRLHACRSVDGIVSKRKKREAA